MTDRTPLVAANWKMNGTRATNEALVEQVITGLPTGQQADVAICPPFVYLADIALELQPTHIQLGAQTVSEHDAGAFTGEVSVSMLQDFGCQYVIVGHSERRHLYGESDRAIAGKFLAAVEADVQPILCLGEQLHEREAGQTETVVARQLDVVIQSAGIEAFTSAVIAYEPVWAIGTGKTATPEQAELVHQFIRERLAEHDKEIAGGIRILYGGSVKPDNAAELFSMANIDGGLIGGASLKADDFIAICQAAE